MMRTTRPDHHKELKSALLWGTLSFVVPAAIMALIMTMCGIAPFGDKTMINQANAAWFESFDGMYRSIVSGEGVFYHLNIGFGTSFYAQFASGLSSPFLFLALFFGQYSLAAAYTFITIVRTGAAGAAAWYMLRKCVSADRAMCFALSCGYSLCGFAAFAAYYPSVADGAVFFPLLAAGIFSFVKESRPVRLFVFGALYFITCPRLTLIGLAASFALYAAFYFQKGSRRQRIYKLAMFAATLFCSAATNAVLVIPVWKGASGYRNGVFFSAGANDLLSDLCFGGYGTSPAGGLGLCLAGLLLLGFFAFMCNLKIRVGEKISVACCAAAILLCHAVPVLADVTLGFANAGGEYVNAGFVLALLAVYSSARAFTETDGLKAWGIACPMAIFAVLAAVSLALRAGDVFSVIAECGLAVFACAVFVQMIVSGSGNPIRLYAVTASVLALFGAVHCAGAVSGIQSQVTASRLRYIAESRVQAREALERSYRQKNEEFPRFYRTRSTDGISDSVDINRNDVEGLTEFAERLGVMRASLYGGADNFTEFTDILFGIAQTDYGFYSKEAAGHKACSPAYLTGDWDETLPEGTNAFELQNYLAGKWFGAKPFEPIETLEHTTELSSESSRYKWTFGNENTVVDKYVFDLPENTHLYMLVADRDYFYAVNSDARSDWRKGCAGGVFSLSREAGGLTVYVSADSAEGSPEPVFMTCSGDLDAAAIAGCAEYISYRNSTVRFLFDTNRAQTAITSIPFEDGWKITVNGQGIEPVRLCGGLIGLRLQKGKNSVVMTYTPPYFRTSLWISALFLAGGLYLTMKVEHEAARRRKVRMAFRAVELNISRLTVDQLEDTPDEAGEEGKCGGSEDNREEAEAQADTAQEKQEKKECEDSDK